MTAYYPLLVLHSAVRWLVLVSMLVTIVRAWHRGRKALPYTRTDDRLRVAALATAHIQAVVGVCLYGISPIIRYFYSAFGEAVHNRQIRFFGMEHSLVMTVAVVVLTMGSARAKRQTTDTGKHKAIWVWYGIALLLILSSVPWAFSPLTSRPWFRWL
jgi:hypothetical protein